MSRVIWVAPGREVARPWGRGATGQGSENVSVGRKQGQGRDDWQ